MSCYKCKSHVIVNFLVARFEEAKMKLLKLILTFSVIANSQVITYLNYNQDFRGLRAGAIV